MCDQCDHYRREIDRLEQGISATEAAWRKERDRAAALETELENITGRVRG